MSTEHIVHLIKKNNNVNTSVADAFRKAASSVK